MEFLKEAFELYCERTNSGKKRRINNLDKFGPKFTKDERDDFIKETMEIDRLKVIHYRCYEDEDLGWLESVTVFYNDIAKDFDEETVMLHEEYIIEYIADCLIEMLE